MKDYDFEGETDRCGYEVMNANELSSLRQGPINAALRRAYAAGQASGGGADLDRLVALAAGHHTWCTNAPATFNDIASDCAGLLDALKAQAVAK